MKRIGIFGPFDPTLCDGVSRSMFELLTFIKNLGHEVFIISLMHEGDLCRQRLLYLIRNPDAQVMSSEESSCNVLFRGVNIDFEILPYKRHEVLRAHGEVLKKAIAKLIGFTDSYLFSVDFDLTSLAAKSVLGIQGAHFIHSPSAIETYTQRPIHGELMRMGSVFVASRFAQSELKRRLGIDSVVWNPFIDLSRFVPKHRRNAKRTIGFYSAGPHKGDELVQHLIRDMPSIQFAIMGGNYTYRSNNFPRNIHYLGNVLDLNEYYKAISLLIVPSTIDEGYPRVVVEAAKNGIPAIANNKGGIPEALGGSGILIDIEPSLDAMVEKYVAAINWLFDNPTEYITYSEKALERSKEYEKELFTQSMRNYENYLAKAPIVSNTSVLQYIA
jgi:glycosyltransferase involved in cell wall biosynthesis